MPRRSPCRRQRLPSASRRSSFTPVAHRLPVSRCLNLYGDGGNVIALERRCAWRGIPVRVDEVHMGEVLDLTDADIVMMGGGSDRDQLAVAHELLAQKDKVAAYVEDSGSLLAICGSYQLLGRSYYMGEDRIEGLGVIAAETVRGSDRLIGNVAVKTDLAP
ncbi:MAG: hypothetical protein ACLTYW_04640, partial [Collinsella sp.]